MTVAESAVGSVTRYVYRVENRTKVAIVSVRVGFDAAKDEPQLHALPAGWTFDAGIPRSSAGAPPGWTLRVVTTEESDRIFLEWSSDGDPRWDIAPGTAIGGFSVTLAHPAAEYRTARFDAILGNGTHISGALERNGQATTP